MANITEPMTLDDIQTEIHALYQSGIDVPAPAEDDYRLRTAMINHYLRVWEFLDGVKWKELRDINTSSVLDNVNLVITLPISFRKLVGKVIVTRPSDGFRKKVTIYSQERLDDDGLDATGYCWVSGETGAFSLNFANMPAEYLGGVVQFRFLRYARRLVDTTDIPDMANPQYLVSMVVSRLFKLAGRTTDYQVNFDDGQDALSSMITNNTELEEGEETEAMGDRIGGFGVMGL